MSAYYGAGHHENAFKSHSQFIRTTCERIKIAYNLKTFNIKSILMLCDCHYEILENDHHHLRFFVNGLSKRVVYFDKIIRSCEDYNDIFLMIEIAVRDTLNLCDEDWKTIDTNKHSIEEMRKDLHIIETKKYSPINQFETPKNSKEVTDYETKFLQYEKTSMEGFKKFMKKKYNLQTLQIYGTFIFNKYSTRVKYQLHGLNDRYPCIYHDIINFEWDFATVHKMCEIAIRETLCLDTEDLRRNLKFAVNNLESGIRPGYG